MTKKVLSFALGFILTLGLFAQKPQRIAYIDMEYILEHIPDYQNAVNQLNQKAEKWKLNLDQLQKEIDQMQLNLSNEKALLTKDLIDERELDISLKVDDLRKQQTKYFGTDGDFFILRQQLTKPVQDQVFNAIQEIATNRQYDFVLDKSSDLIMLYSNDKYDISDMIVKSITRTEKQKEMKEKIDVKDPFDEKELTEEQIKRQEENEQKKAEQVTKKEEMLNKVEQQKADRAKLREEQIKASEEAKLKKLQEKEEAQKKLEEKKAAEKKAREDKQQNEIK